MKKLLSILLIIVMILSLFGCGNRTNDADQQAAVRTIPDGTDSQVANLYRLCKVWGFAKYTHPVFNSGEKCWDEELLNLIPIVRFADEDEVTDILYNWFVGLGDDGYDGFDGGDFDFNARQQADKSWINEIFLGERLYAVFSRFNGINFILDWAHSPALFNPIFQTGVFSNQDVHEHMDFSDENYRLMGLFRLWNAMEYFFPYRDIMDDDWSELLLHYIPVMLEGDDQLSYELVLVRMASRLQDAHISFVRNWRPPMNAVIGEYFGQYVVPVSLTEVDGQLVVRAVDRSEDINVPLMPGDIILTLDGRDVIEFTTYMAQYISYPEPARMLEYMAYFQDVLRSHEYMMEIGVLRGDEKMTIEARGRTSRMPQQSMGASHERLDDNIGLINPAFLRRDDIHRIMDYFRDTDGLIIDLRQYPSFPISFDLAEYLVDENKLFAILSTPSQTVPGVFLDSIRLYSGGIKSPDAYFYDRNVVILMDIQSASQPETSIMSLRNGPNVTVMGRNSVGANGDITSLPLPCGNIMFFSGLGVYTPEGGQTQRIGLSPDIRVPQTIEGIREGRDELMETAIEFLSGG